MSEGGADKADLTNAGIALNAEGQRIIPATVRADGTVRKERKVKPGYRPPEDVEIYRNRSAQGWKQRVESSGVLGAEAVSSESDFKPQSANAKKKAKRKEAAKKKVDGGEKPSDGEWIRKGPLPDEPAPAPAKKTADEMTPEEREKAAKALRKKIRQAQDLKKKKDEGEALLPEQLQKVIKVVELTRQLEALGFKE